MNKMPEMLVNRPEAHDFAQSLDDPAIRLILDLAEYHAHLSFFPRDNMDEEAMLKQLPALPFDMLFFVKTVAKLFGDKKLIADILSGEVTAESLRESYE